MRDMEEAHRVRSKWTEISAQVIEQRLKEVRSRSL
jgi:hypothetical protein